jgi:flagellar biosynthesis regulator FlaF
MALRVSMRDIHHQEEDSWIEAKPSKSKGKTMPKQAYEKQAYEKQAYEKQAYEKQAYEKQAYEKQASEKQASQPVRKNNFSHSNISNHKSKMNILEVKLIESLSTGVKPEELKSIVETYYSDGMEIAIKWFITHWIHEVLPLIYSTTQSNVAERNGYNGYKWLNIALFPKFDIRLSRSIEDGIKTLDFLLSNKNNIYSKNIEEETTIDALKISFTEGKISKEYFDTILWRFYQLKYHNIQPNEHISDDNELYKFILYINNKITRTTTYFAPIINYIVDYNASIFVDVIVNEFIMYKKTSKDTGKMIYKFVQDRFWTIIHFLTIDPSTDKNYDQYFKTNKWNSVTLQQKFCKAVIDRCLSYDIQKYQREEDSFETIGAFIGLAGKHYPKHKNDVLSFIEKCAKYDIHTAFISMIHLNEMHPIVIQELLKKYSTLNAKDKFMLLDTIKLVKNIQKKSISFEEAVSACEYNIINVEQIIEENVQEKNDIDYEDKSYNIIIGLMTLKEDDNIIINQKECFPACIDDAYYSLTKLRETSNYSDETMLLHLLLTGIRTFKESYHVDKLMVFCKNLFQQCDEICKKYEIDILDEAMNENPKMVSILPLV